MRPGVKPAKRLIRRVYQKVQSIDMQRESEITTQDDPARMAAYRRLAAVILSLDVATLASELRTARLELTELDRAA